MQRKKACGAYHYGILYTTFAFPFCVNPVLSHYAR